MRRLVFIEDALVLMKDEPQSLPDRRKIDLFLQPLPIKKTVRLVVDFGGQLRSLAWLQIGFDGSVYWGPSRTVTGRGFFREGRKAYIAQQSAEAELINDAEEQKRFHLSFHPSGAVNAGKARSYRRAWRDLERPEQLCSIAWEHPRSLASVSSRKRDLAIRYPIDETKPLFGSLNVVPAGLVAVLANAEWQQILEFEVIGNHPVPRMTVQLALGHGLSGPWPGGTNVSWRTLGPPSVQS